MKKQSTFRTVSIIIIVIFIHMLTAKSQLSIIPEGMNMQKRVPVNTLPASSLDFTKNQDNTGNVSLPIPLVSLGGVDVQLKYYNKDIANNVRTENRYAPSGSVGLGWQLVYGSISGEIGGNADAADDRYFYNGPDGSFELIEGVDGIFRIPSYKPWKIQRVMNGNTLLGWTITKEDGTILRFGNYDMSSGQFPSPLAYAPTNATRYFLGCNGLVANPPHTRYSNLERIPYQWDLSNIQDIGGNQTTIIYSQVQLPLVSGTNSSATYNFYYTRESHISEINDNMGNKISFNYTAMNENEYFNNYSNWTQNLVDTLSLTSVQIKRNNQLYKQIAFMYDTTSFLGTKKRFLKSFSFQDKDGNPLPSYRFSYYTSATDIVPGSIKSVTSPDGGTVTYTYKTQQLQNVQLAMKNVVNPIDYYDVTAAKPNDDGLGGKDFVVIRDINNALRVYRQGAMGWLLDNTFPFDTQRKILECKTSNDYVTVFDSVTSRLYAIKRTSEGWKQYDVDEALIANGCTVGPMGAYVVGLGSDYFVVIHNMQGTYAYYPSWEISVIKFGPTKLLVYKYPGGRFYDGRAMIYGDDCISTGLSRFVSMKAFCGENYFVLASMNASGYGTVFSHFRYSSQTQQWNPLLENGDLYAGPVGQSHFDLNLTQPHRVYIGKNFIVMALNDGGGCGGIGATKLRVYRRDAWGTGITLVDSLYRNFFDETEISNIIVDDDYYAYTYTTPHNADLSANNRLRIRTWNAETNSFETSVDNNFQGIFNRSESGSFKINLVKMGNRLVLTCSPQGTVCFTGYYEYTPKSTQKWTPYLIHEQIIPLAGGGTTIVGTVLNQNTFIRTSYSQGYGFTQLILLHAFQLQGNTVSVTRIDSLWTDHYLSSQWIWQPGGNFLAFARAGRANGLGIPDSLNMYTLNNLPNGTMQWSGSPIAVVVSQKTYASGMGDNATNSFTFDPISGIMNQYFTPEYENVKDSLPGNNGKTVSLYYTSKDLIIPGMNYKNLAGMMYNVKNYNNQNIVVNEKRNTWKAVGVDSINGVFSTQLTADSTFTDDVLKTTYYTYGDLAHAFQLSQIIETNSDGKKRITNMKYPLDYSVTNPSTSDLMIRALNSMKNTKNMINPVIEKWIIQDEAGNQKVVSADLMLYKEYGPDQILPHKQFKLFSASPLPVGSFTLSNTLDGYHFGYSNSYALQKTIDAYDSYGNLLQQTDANGVPATVKWGYNSTAPIGIFTNATASQTFVDEFGGNTDLSGWTKIDSMNDGDTHWNVTDNGMLEQKNYGNAQNEEGDRIVYNNVSEISGSVVFEFDLMIDNSNNWDFAIAMGNSQYSGWSYGTGCAVWTAFKNRIWYATGAAVIKSDFLLGKTYHLKIVANCTTKKADFYVDGILCLKNSSFRTTVTGIKKISFCNYGYPSATTTWYIDNVRLYPETAIAKNQSYLPTFMSINQISDENGNRTNYGYDNFGRLSSIKDGQGNLLKDYSYYFSRAGNGEVFNASDPNYTQERSYRTSSDYSTNKTYIDGLGRDIQKQTFLNSDDIISHITYDPMGRTQRAYKPYQVTLGSNAHKYDPNYHANARTYYQNLGVAAGEYPYSETSYLTDPTNRILKQAAPGNDFRMGTGKEIEFNYTTDAVNKLLKNIKKDEDDQQADEYIDLFGKTVKSVVDPGGLNLTTSFEYDILGNVLKSTPPNGSSYSSSYQYNTLQKLTQKASPDAGTVKYLYDYNGNLRLIKDANHSSTSVNSVNSGTKSVAHPSIGTYPFTLNLGGKVTLKAARTSGSSTVTVSIKTTGGTTLYSINGSSSTVNTGTIILPKGSYVCEGKPLGSGTYTYAVICTTGYELVYNKYDAFNRITEQGEYSSNVLTSFSQQNAFTATSGASFPSTGTLISKSFGYDLIFLNPAFAKQRNLKGKLSFSSSYRLGSFVDTSYYSYDEFGRVEWIIQKGLGSALKTITYSYDQFGNVTSKSTQEAGGVLHQINYTYDKAGRVGTVSSASSPAASYQYLAPGTVSQLNLGNGLEIINYKYNSRDWLTNINESTTPRFSMTLGYNEAVSSYLTRTAKYNGNISWMKYSMKDVIFANPVNPTTLVGYTFDYDKANRLISSNFAFDATSQTGGWISTNALSERNFIYDNNGNIRNLKRFGEAESIIDSLKYNYQTGTNKLDSVTVTLKRPPTLTVAPSNLSFGNVILPNTSDKFYVLQGSNLLPASGNITITPQAGYKVSLSSGSGFTSSPIQVAYTGGLLAAKTIYVRFQPTAVQDYNKSISNAGGGAATKNVTVTGSGITLFAPTGFTATPGNCGTGTIYLSWNASSGATRYIITDDVSTVYDGPNLSCSHTGLTPGSGHYYYIQAWNSTGQSSQPSFLDPVYAPNVCPPSAPTGFTATPGNCGTGTIYLSWNASSGATRYIITDDVSTVYDGPNLSFSHTGLASGSGHYYYIQAWNSTGQSSQPSFLDPVYAPNVCPPSAPTGFTATPGNCGTGTINLSWSAVSGATRYIIYDDVTVIYDGPNLSCSHTGLAPGSGHYYYIQAWNSSGYSSPSFLNPVYAPTECVPPTPPTGFTATPVSTTQVYLSWNSVSGANSYTLKNSSGTTLYSGSGTGYTNSGLTCGTYYYYYLTANNTSGSSSQVTAGATTSACAPSYYTVTASASAGGTISPTSTTVTSGGSVTFTVQCYPYVLGFGIYVNGGYHSYITISPPSPNTIYKTLTISNITSNTSVSVVFD